MLSCFAGGRDVEAGWEGGELLLRFGSSLDSGEFDLIKSGSELSAFGEFARALFNHGPTPLCSNRVESL